MGQPAQPGGAPMVPNMGGLDQDTAKQVGAEDGGAAGNKGAGAEKEKRQRRTKADKNKEGAADPNQPKERAGRKPRSKN